jgi:hypothetical protein
LDSTRSGSGRRKPTGLISWESIRFDPKGQSELSGSLVTATLLQPWALGVLVVWSFGVLSAAQLTIRLIMGFSVRLTLIAAAVLSAAAIVIAVLDDAFLGDQASLVRRIELAPIPMLLMAVAGFAIARWLLRIKRVRGQLIAGLMVGVLDPHLFTLL